MPITPVAELVRRANLQIASVSATTALTMLGDPRYQFVDIRDIRELEREGTIPGALHAPRGMLEFWVDPKSPYHKPVFAEAKQFILFCASAWRSALATQSLDNMGMTNVAHLTGGFQAWVKAGAPITGPGPRKPG